MVKYCIVEIEDGWTVVERPEDGTAEQAAHHFGGIVIDPGPYESYEDACDALDALQSELDETDAQASDIPGTQAAEDRSEWNL